MGPPSATNAHVDAVRERPVTGVDVRFRPREPVRKPAYPCVQGAKWIPRRKSRSTRRPRLRSARRGLSRTFAGEGSPRGAGHGAQRSEHTAHSRRVKRGSVEAHCDHFAWGRYQCGRMRAFSFSRRRGRPLRLTERRNAPKDALRQLPFHMSMTEAPLTFPSMMSIPCCRAARLAIPKSENACGWFSLKTRLAAEVAIAPGRQIRTAMSYPSA